MADEEDEIDMDPTEFLAHDDNESEKGFNDSGPPILTSLGLTHRTHVNPYSFLVCFLTFGFFVLSFHCSFVCHQPTRNGIYLF